MGHPETAVATVVAKLGLGTVCPYDPAAFLKAVGTVTDPECSRQNRSRANQLKPKCSADGVADFI